jgi:hypothetical protein
VFLWGGGSPRLPAPALPAALTHLVLSAAVWADGLAAIGVRAVGLAALLRLLGLALGSLAGGAGRGPCGRLRRRLGLKAQLRQHCIQVLQLLLLLLLRAGKRRVEGTHTRECSGIDGSETRLMLLAWGLHCQACAPLSNVPS